MGGGQSVSQKQKTSILNKIISDVCVDQSVRCGATIRSEIKFLATGGARISDIDAVQWAKISLICLQKTDVNMKMQADIVTKIMNEATQNSSLGLQASSADNDTDIENDLRNIVASHLNIDAVARLQATVEQTLDFTADGRGSELTDIRASQVSESLGSVVNDLSSEIVSTLMSASDVTNKADTTTTSAVVDALDSIGRTLSSLWTWSSNSVIMVAIVVIGSVAAYYFTMGGGGGSVAPTNPNVPIATVVEKASASFLPLPTNTKVPIVVGKALNTPSVLKG